MAVYYKFKSAKDYDLIPIDGHYISVINLKQKIYESKYLGRGKDFDLVVTNAQTNQGYLDEDMLIPKNTSVLICRVPGLPRKPIVTQPDMPNVEDEPSDPQPAKSSFFGADSSALKYLDDSEWDEFGNDLYAIPEATPVQRIDPIMDAPPPSKADEDSKIQALIETPALDWQHQASNGSGGGGFGRGIGGKMMRGRGFGRQDFFERKTPPEHYVCHRCKVPGHFIQHCPTNGDPNYDVKRVRPPTGIPKSMLMATPDGSYALPSGVVAVLKPNEAAFEKEIDGLPSTRSVGDLPPELNCPLCKEVMKDAVLTSRCCFKSFCDKCIRDHIISRSMCSCGATNVLADDLLPNKTLRDTIDRILESNSSSAENSGSAFNVRDMESARCPQPRVSSPNMAVTSMQDKLPQTCNEVTSSIKVTTEEEKSADASQLTPEKEKMAKTVDMSEATLAAISVKEPTLRQGSAPLAEGLLPNSFGEAGKKKKKQKTYPPMNAGDLQWNNSQDLATENFMMPFGASPYNPYWTGMQIGMEGYMASYPGPMNYMNYGFGPMDMPFLGVVPPDRFVAQGYILPGILPERNLAEFGMGLNAKPPLMSREEVGAPKVDLKRKRENESQEIKRRAESRDQNISRGVGSNGDISSMKSKSGSIPPMSIPDSHRPRPSEKLSPEHSNHEAKSPRPQKRKADHHHSHRDHHNSYTHHRNHHHHDRPAILSSTGTATEPPTAKSKSADGKQERSIFSRIGFPDEEAPKKWKFSSTVAAAGGASSFTSAHHRGLSKGYYEDRKSSSTPAAKAMPPTSSDVVGIRGSAMDYDESSDDDRHFKRKSSRYEPSPPPPERER